MRQRENKDNVDDIEKQIKSGFPGILYLSSRSIPSKCEQQRGCLQHCRAPSESCPVSASSSPEILTAILHIPLAQGLRVVCCSIARGSTSTAGLGCRRNQRRVGEIPNVFLQDYRRKWYSLQKIIHGCQHHKRLRGAVFQSPSRDSILLLR